MCIGLENIQFSQSKSPNGVPPGRHFRGKERGHFKSRSDQKLLTLAPFPQRNHCEKGQEARTPVKCLEGQYGSMFLDVVEFWRSLLSDHERPGPTTSLQLAWLGWRSRCDHGDLGDCFMSPARDATTCSRGRNRGPTRPGLLNCAASAQFGMARSPAFWLRGVVVVPGKGKNHFVPRCRRPRAEAQPERSK